MQRAACVWEEWSACWKPVLKRILLQRGVLVGLGGSARGGEHTLASIVHC